MPPHFEWLAMTTGTGLPSLRHRFAHHVDEPAEGDDGEADENHNGFNDGMTSERIVDPRPDGRRCYRIKTVDTGSVIESTGLPPLPLNVLRREWVETMGGEVGMMGPLFGEYYFKVLNSSIK